MAPPRRAAVGMGLLSAALIVAAGAANCASPTQIVIDVRADPAICSTLITGLAVTSVDAIDTEKFEEYEKGCEAKSDRVGTLTITPGGDNDAIVGIRVVGATNGADPDRCGLPGPDGKPVWDNCVLVRRRVRFSPGKTVNLTVRLTDECVGRYCGGALECNLGVCVQASQVQPDGGNTPPLNDGDMPIEDVFVPDDATVVPEASDNDACARCSGGACSAGLCRIDCANANCFERTLCSPGLDCVIECGQGSSCKGTRCATDRSCTFTCAAGPKRCENIACSAGTCAVMCQQSSGVCDGVYVDGGTNVVRCAVANDKPTCDDVRCSGGTCQRQCNDGGCGPSTSCSGNCGLWDDAAPPQ